MGGGGGVAWGNWAAGVLAGVSAPASSLNFTSLWNWSNKESGADVMRWNNPLNTTMPGYGGINENSVGVKAYPSVVDGIAATVATLLNGRYPTIVANLRNQRPHGQWQNANAELDTWGTGTNWLGWALVSPLGGDDLTPHESQLLEDVHAALSRVEGALGTATPAGPAAPQPNYKGFADDVSSALAKLAAGGLTAEQNTALTQARDAIVRMEKAFQAA